MSFDTEFKIVYNKSDGGMRNMSSEVSVSTANLDDILLDFEVDKIEVDKNQSIKIFQRGNEKLDITMNKECNKKGYMLDSYHFIGEDVRILVSNYHKLHTRERNNTSFHEMMNTTLGGNMMHTMGVAVKVSIRNYDNPEEKLETIKNILEAHYTRKKSAPMSLTEYAKKEVDRNKRAPIHELSIKGPGIFVSRSYKPK